MLILIKSLYALHSLQVYFGLDFRRNLDVVSNETGLYSTERFTAEAVSKIENHNKSQVSASEALLNMVTLWNSHPWFCFFSKLI